jgi:zinc transport system substrate-binding protein
MHGRRILTALILWSTTCIAPAHATVRVVATIFPLADMVRQVGKDAVEVVTLLPPGASPHTFEPTPAQIRELAHAAVFVQVGAGLDAWAAKLLAANPGTIRVVTIADGLTLIGNAEAHGSDGDPHRGEPHGGDPHVWLDPILVRDHAVPAITAALIQA